MTAEIKQTYDLLKFAMHLTALINTSEATRKVERPKRKRQMYKCHEP